MSRHHEVSWLSSWWLARLIKATRPFARGVLLDVGCGAAPYRGFFEVTRHITLDWPNSAHDQSNIEVFASAEALPIRTASIDTVLCTEVLEHLRNPMAAISEASRVLRPGGHLILTVPFLYGIHERPHDFYRFTEYGLKHLLTEFEFDIVEFAHRGGSMAVVTDLAGKITHRTLSVALRAAGVPVWLRSGLLGFATGAPQRAMAGVTRIGERLAPRVGAVLGGQQATLGYVVVARRKAAR